MNIAVRIIITFVVSVAGGTLGGLLYAAVIAPHMPWNRKGRDG